VNIQNVLDASALLALLRKETGWENVASQTTQSAISVVNWSEVIQKILVRGGDVVDVTVVRQGIEVLGISLILFTSEDAERAAQLWLQAKHLSLGDRACLALALRLGVPALTADKIWEKLAIGVEVKLIR
jgi:ribonuclease VapC